MNAENTRQCLTDIESPYRRTTAVKKTGPLYVCGMAQGWAVFRLAKEARKDTE